MLIRNNKPITQVAIGNNLLIFDWITDLVKLNRSFIVKRDTGVREALEAAKHLSAYIHYVISSMKESVWIAQREGRAKDSNDKTQESVIKMLSLAGNGDSKTNILELNIVPVAISYEYDPNDYLKAREFLLRRRDPNFKKSQRDDLFSMETGILKHKGRVHFHVGKCINTEIEKCDCDNRAPDGAQYMRYNRPHHHCGYRIFPCNYIAYDELESSDRHSKYYTAAASSLSIIISNISSLKVDVTDITPEEHSFMRRMMLTMYSNPLRNQLAASDCRKDS